MTVSLRNKALAAVCAVGVIASGFVFSQRSKSNLEGLHPDLVALASLCLELSPVDFVVIDGLRSVEEQRQHVARGVSWTIRSRHLEGKAFDVAALDRGKITYEHEPYIKIAAACKTASYALAVPIVWGGDWKQKDMMHFELDRKAYP